MADRIYGKARSRAVIQFLSEIESVCRKHGLSLSHEDHQGCFIVEPFDERLLDWLKDASEDGG